MSNILSRDSWLFVVRGVLAIGLGVLAFVAPGATLAALIAVFAFYAIFDGGLAIIAGFNAPRGTSWWLVAGGVAGIALGIFTFMSPDTTALALVLLVGIWAIVTGVAELIAAATVGAVFGNRLLYVLSGIISVAFGVLLVMSPGDGILSVLWLVGFYAIFAGAMYLAVAFGLRETSDALASIEANSNSSRAAS